MLDALIALNSKLTLSAIAEPNAYMSSRPDKEKMQQEQASLLQIKDGFRKVIITADRYLSGYNEQGIRILSLKNFLFDGIS